MSAYKASTSANVKNNPQSEEVQRDFLASLEVCFLLFMGEDFIRLCYGSPPNVRPCPDLCDERHLLLAYV